MTRLAPAKGLALSLVACVCIAACSETSSTTAPRDRGVPSFDSGPGSGGSGGGDGGTQPTGPIQNVFIGQNPMVSGDTSSVLVSFTQSAPAEGYTLALKSNDPAVLVPATYQAPAGAFVVHVPLSTTPITDARNFLVTVTLLGQSKSNGAKLYPRTATLAAPALFKPGDRSGFKMREIVDFDWNDQNNAWCYHLQMDDDPNFTGYPAYGELCTPNSFWRQSAFGPVGSTTYWRVRAQDASGNPGPWSVVRSFVIKD